MNLNRITLPLATLFTLVLTLPSLANAAEEIAANPSLPIPLAAPSASTFDKTLSEKSLDDLAEAYTVDTTKGKVSITLRESGEAGHASVYVNGRETVRYRAELHGLSPAQRARQTAFALAQFLKTGGSPAEIKPGLENGMPVVRAGSELLALVDARTAEASKNPDRHLALLWTNFTREALGAPAINRGATVSRGMSARSDEIPAGFDFDLSRLVSAGPVWTGMASWYGPGFHGRRAANGSRFDMNAFTAAHKSLPFGTLVRVLNHRTGRSCVVKITDRGPYIHGRIIDLSKGAAQAIGLLGSGVAKVTISILTPQALVRSR